MKVYCGIDWAEHHHDVALVDETGKVIAQRRITETISGYQELLEMFTAAGDGPGEMIPVAIETPHGPAGHRATGLRPEGVRDQPAERIPVSGTAWSLA